MVAGNYSRHKKGPALNAIFRIADQTEFALYHLSVIETSISDIIFYLGFTFQQPLKFEETGSDISIGVKYIYTHTLPITVKYIRSSLYL